MWHIVFWHYITWMQILAKKCSSTNVYLYRWKKRKFHLILSICSLGRVSNCKFNRHIRMDTYKYTKNRIYIGYTRKTDTVRFQLMVPEAKINFLPIHSLGLSFFMFMQCKVWNGHFRNVNGRIKLESVEIFFSLRFFGSLSLRNNCLVVFRVYLL